MLTLPDAWAWDFWVADDGERYHLFSLNAPRSLGDPELRHRSAGVGHAVSSDLCTWELLPDALRAPAPPGGPDDLAIWTGCVVRAGAARGTSSTPASPTSTASWSRPRAWRRPPTS